jgi:hypothetical protein
VVERDYDRTADTEAEWVQLALIDSRVSEAIVEIRHAGVDGWRQVDSGGLDEIGYFDLLSASDLDPQLLEDIGRSEILNDARLVRFRLDSTTPDVFTSRVTLRMQQSKPFTVYAEDRRTPHGAVPGWDTTLCVFGPGNRETFIVAAEVPADGTDPRLVEHINDVVANPFSTRGDIHAASTTQRCGAVGVERATEFGYRNAAIAELLPSRPARTLIIFSGIPRPDSGADAAIRVAAMH